MTPESASDKIPIALRCPAFPNYVSVPDDTFFISRQGRLVRYSLGYQLKGSHLFYHKFSFASSWESCLNTRLLGCILKHLLRYLASVNAIEKHVCEMREGGSSFLIIKYCQGQVKTHVQTSFESCGLSIDFRSFDSAEWLQTVMRFNRLKNVC